MGALASPFFLFFESGGVGFDNLLVVCGMLGVPRPIPTKRRGALRVLGLLLSQGRTSHRTSRIPVWGVWWAHGGLAAHWGRLAPVQVSTVDAGICSGSIPGPAFIGG